MNEKIDFSNFYKIQEMIGLLPEKYIEDACRHLDNLKAVFRVGDTEIRATSSYPKGFVEAVIQRIIIRNESRKSVCIEFGYKSASPADPVIGFVLSGLFYPSGCLTSVEDRAIMSDERERRQMLAEKNGEKWFKADRGYLEWWAATYKDK